MSMIDDYDNWKHEPDAEEYELPACDLNPADALERRRAKSVRISRGTTLAILEAMENADHGNGPEDTAAYYAIQAELEWALGYGYGDDEEIRGPGRPSLQGEGQA